MRTNRGFTLIELSIVLVIIGLIIGGVLVGQDLINAAAIRAQISQIEKFQAAANTFRGKYGYLPGDIPDPAASQYGFAARGTLPGQGDGNGLLEGYGTFFSPAQEGFVEGAGETPMFWVDLSVAQLINGSFTTASPTAVPGSAVTGTALNQWFPTAKLRSNYIYAWSISVTSLLGAVNPPMGRNINYYAIAPISSLNAPAGSLNAGAGVGGLNNAGGLSVMEAYNIDKKMDDGKPYTGNVLALALSPYPWWGNAGHWGYDPYTTATAAASDTCMDNGGVAGTNWVYSTGQNGGTAVICSLSFKFQ